MLSDWPQQDTVQSQQGTASTTLVISQGGNFSNNSVIVIDQEMEYVVTVPGTGTQTLTVTRAFRGTSAQTHAVGAGVLVNPLYSPQDILDGLNEGLRQLWPYYFKRVFSTGALTVSTANVAEYALPTPFDKSLSRVMRVSLLNSGGQPDMWRDYRRFEIIRAGNAAGATLHFTGPAPELGTQIRLHGVAAFETDMAFGGATDTDLPDAAIPALVMYACHYCLLQTEARRLLRTGASNVGTSSSPPGAQTQLSTVWLNKFVAYCQKNAQAWPSSYTRRRF